jgi:hypothetical protein
VKLRYIFSAFLLIIFQNGFSQNVFTKIPTPPHKHEVDIFFTHELPVKEPNFRTTMLEVQGGNNYNELIIKLKEKAQLFGADGVIIVEKDFDYLAGIGIKYNKNISQIFDTLNVIKKISIIPIDTKTISGDVLFDMDGKLMEGQQAGMIGYFIENVFNYDFKFLLYDKSTTFNYDDKDGKLLSISIKYKEDNRIDERRREKLIPTYDEKGNLTELKVFWKDVLVRHQKLFYDAKKRLIMADWSRFEKGIEVPFLRADYQYYRTEDLPK